MRRSTLILVVTVMCTLNLVAQSPELRGIAHVAFRVDDLQKAREFYQMLGFEQAFEFSDAGKTSVSFIKINDSRDWPTAVREFQAVVAWNPEDASAHYDLAIALKARGQHDEAAHELQVAQRLNPALRAPR
jgi:tetratricopeptide (TPR) repeat protein